LSVCQPPLGTRGFGTVFEQYHWTEEQAGDSSRAGRIAILLTGLYEFSPTGNYPQAPLQNGSRVGVHSLERGGYYVARVDSFGFQRVSEEDDSALFAFAKPLQADLLKPLIDDQTGWGYTVFLWYPVSDSLTQDEEHFSPAKYNGFKPLCLTNINPLPDYELKRAVEKILADRNLEPLPFLYELNVKKTLPGDDSGMVEFYNIEVPFITDSLWGCHEMVLRHERQPQFDRDYAYNKDLFQVVEISTNRDSLFHRTSGFVEEDNYYFEVEETYTEGVLDVDFDGLYEVVVTVYNGDVKCSHNSIITSIYTFKNGKMEQVGLNRVRGGC